MSNKFGILEALLLCDIPMSIDKLNTALGDVDRSGIYRKLQVLLGEKLVERTDANEYQLTESGEKAATDRLGEIPVTVPKTVDVLTRIANMIDDSSINVEKITVIETLENMARSLESISKDLNELMGAYKIANGIPE